MENNKHTICLPKELLFLIRLAVELYMKFRLIDYENLLLENKKNIQDVIKLLFNHENDLDDFVFYDDEVEDKSIYSFLVQQEFDLIDEIITINGPHKYFERYISKSYLINALPLKEIIRLFFECWVKNNNNIVEEVIESLYLDNQLK